MRDKIQSHPPPPCPPRPLGRPNPKNGHHPPPDPPTRPQNPKTGPDSNIHAQELENPSTPHVEPENAPPGENIISRDRVFEYAKAKSGSE